MFLLFLGRNASPLQRLLALSPNSLVITIQVAEERDKWVEGLWPSGSGHWIGNLEVPDSNPPPFNYLDLFSVVPSSTLRQDGVN